MNQREEKALKDAIVAVLRANVWPLGWRDIQKKVHEIAAQHGLSDLTRERSVEISHATKAAIKGLVLTGVVVEKDEPFKVERRTRSGRAEFVYGKGYMLI